MGFFDKIKKIFNKEKSEPEKDSEFSNKSSKVENNKNLKNRSEEYTIKEENITFNEENKSENIEESVNKEENNTFNEENKSENKNLSVDEEERKQNERIDILINFLEINTTNQKLISQIKPLIKNKTIKSKSEILKEIKINKEYYKQLIKEGRVIREQRLKDAQLKHQKEEELKKAQKIKDKELKIQRQKEIQERIKNRQSQKNKNNDEEIQIESQEDNSLKTIPQSTITFLNNKELAQKKLGQYADVEVNLFQETLKKIGGETASVNKSGALRGEGFSKFNNAKEKWDAIKNELSNNLNYKISIEEEVDLEDNYKKDLSGEFKQENSSLKYTYKKDLSGEFKQKDSSLEDISKENIPPTFEIESKDIELYSRDLTDTGFKEENPYSSENIENFTYLDNLIKQSQGELVLDSNIKLEDNEKEIYPEGILIDKDLIIDGNFSYIDASALTSIFRLSGCNVCFKNIIFKNGFSNDGGAIEISKESDVKITNCSFEDNKTKSSGAAINNFGNLYLENSTFKNNRSKRDGAAINNNEWASLKILKVCFKSNTADFKGGAINNLGYLDLESSNFENNKSNWREGGAIFNSAIFKLNNSNFINNSSQKNGGALSITGKGEVKISKAYFEENKADIDGGAIYIKKEELFDISTSDFVNNRTGGNGGAIFNNKGKVNIIQSNFKNDNETLNIIYQDTNEDNALFITDSYFKADTELINNKGGFCSIEKTKFYGNLQINNNSDIKIIKSEFTSSKTVLNNKLIRISANTNLKESDIKQGPNAKDIVDLDTGVPEEVKGFTYLENLISKGNNVILDCDIEMDYREQNFYEGGIELSKDGLTIDGAGHTIDAIEESRIFYITGENITLKNIVFKNGKQKVTDVEREIGGGVIYSIHKTSLTIENCEFSDNDSREHAGAIFSQSEKLSIDNSTFKNNLSQNNGGAIYTPSESHLKVTNSIFTSNNAKINGGAIYNLKAQLELNNSTLTENKVGKNGGAIFIDKKADTTILNCDFIKNRSSLMGGAIYTKADLILNDFTFESNTANEYGGALYILKGNITLDSIEFKENKADHYGGAIYIQNGNLHSNLSNFKSNKAEKGGAIASWGDIDFKNSEFRENEADCVYIRPYREVSLLTCKFIANKGIDVYNDKSQLILKDSQFDKTENKGIKTEEMVYSNCKFNIKE